MAHALTRVAHIVISAAAMAVMLPTIASAATIHVNAWSIAAREGCGTAAAPCANLADAMLAADGGETIQVGPGSYAGVTIDKPVTLLGTHAGRTGASRGAAAAGSSMITGQLRITANVTVDGFHFPATAGHAAIQLDQPTNDLPIGGPVLRNNTFAGGRAISAVAAYVNLRVLGNLFDGQAGGEDVAIRLLTTIDTNVSGNVFRGLADDTNHDAAAIWAAESPGLQVLDNVVESTDRLLAMEATTGAPAVVRGNVGTDFGASAIELSDGVHGIQVERNRFERGGGAALSLSGSASTNVSFTGNDVTGFRHGFHVAEGSLADTLQARGNRIVGIPAGGTSAANYAAGSHIDARGNWWGASAGTSSPRIGSVDVSDPLRLVGVEAPAAVTVNGSGSVAVSLIGAVGTGPEPDAGLFAATFATTAGTLDSTRVDFVGGRARTSFTAGAEVGETTTTVTLDQETVSATTRILSFDSVAPEGNALPSVAESRPSGASRARFRSSIGVNRGSLRRAASRGVLHVVRSDRTVGVRTQLSIEHYDARRLGLRRASSRSTQPFVIGTARTTMTRGAKRVRIRLSKRARWAIVRTDRRIGVTVVTRVTARNGFRATMIRHNVLPANVR